MQVFGIEGIDLKDFRFRSYDHIAKLKMQDYSQYDQTLLKLQFKGYKVLVIETKLPEEEFEIYNPDLLQLRAIKFVEGEKYDFKRLESLPTLPITVNKKEQTVTDLEKVLAEMYGIPEERLVIMLRHNSYNNSVKGEIYNMAWRKPKKIEDAAKFDHGCVLYLEEGDIKDKIETF